MTDNITARIAELVKELAVLHDEALEAVNTGREFSQRQLRVRFNQLKRINSDLGQAQFDMANSPVWEYLTEEDREALNGFIDETIKGADMLKAVLS
jgi:hypothetical protein